MPIKPPAILPTDLRQWTRFFQESIVDADNNATISDGDIPSTIARVTAMNAGDSANSLALSTHAAAADPHPVYTTSSEVSASIAAASITEAQITDGAFLARNAGNETISGDWTFSAPPRIPTYTVAGAPSAATYARGLIYVSNEVGGAVIAFSDGTNWRRVTDRAVIA